LGDQKLNKNILVAIFVVTVIVIGGWMIISNGQNEPLLLDTTSDSGNDTSPNELDSCKSVIAIGDITVEKDPAGDAESWIRFDYTSSAVHDLSCNYSITIKNFQGEIVRTTETQDTFTYPSGQVSNGYSDTPYQAGMSVEITLD